MYPGISDLLPFRGQQTRCRSRKATSGNLVTVNDHLREKNLEDKARLPVTDSRSVVSSCVFRTTKCIGLQLQVQSLVLKVKRTAAQRRAWSLCSRCWAQLAHAQLSLASSSGSFLRWRFYFGCTTKEVSFTELFVQSRVTSLGLLPVPFCEPNSGVSRNLIR